MATPKAQLGVTSQWLAAAAAAAASAAGGILCESKGTDTAAANEGRPASRLLFLWLERARACVVSSWAKHAKEQRATLKRERVCQVQANRKIGGRERILLLLLLLA